MARREHGEKHTDDEERETDIQLHRAGAVDRRDYELDYVVSKINRHTVVKIKTPHSRGVFFDTQGRVNAAAAATDTDVGR